MWLPIVALSSQKSHFIFLRTSHYAVIQLQRSLFILYMANSPMGDALDEPGIVIIIRNVNASATTVSCCIYSCWQWLWGFHANLKPLSANQAIFTGANDDNQPKRQHNWIKTTKKRPSSHLPHITAPRPKNRNAVWIIGVDDIPSVKNRRDSLNFLRRGCRICFIRS